LAGKVMSKVLFDSEGFFLVDTIPKRTRFGHDEALVTAAKQWLRLAGPEFYRADIQTQVPSWRKPTGKARNYVEKYLLRM
jgi:hypothetical protein